MKTMAITNHGQKQINLKMILIGAILAIGGLLIASPASHAKREVAISPAKTQIELKAGREFKGSFKVFNPGDEDFKFTVEATPYRVTDESYSQVFNDQQNTPRTQLSRWISFDQTEYSLAKGKDVRVEYTVKVPTNIPDGNQYAAIFVTTDASTEGSIQGQLRAGMLVHAKTDGKTTEEGKIIPPSIKFLHFTTKLDFDQRIENSGNTDFDANVTTRVETIFGKSLFEDRKNDVTIMAETTRAIDISWTQAPIFGLFKVIVETKILDQTETTTKWALFVSPIIIVVIILILISLTLWVAYAKKKKNRFGR